MCRAEAELKAKTLKDKACMKTNDDRITQSTNGNYHGLYEAATRGRTSPVSDSTPPKSEHVGGVDVCTPELHDIRTGISRTPSESHKKSKSNPGE